MSDREIQTANVIDVSKALAAIRTAKILQTELLQQAQASTNKAIADAKAQEAEKAAISSADIHEKIITGDPEQQIKDTINVRRKIVTIQNTEYREQIKEQDALSTSISETLDTVKADFEQAKAVEDTFTPSSFAAYEKSVNDYVDNAETALSVTIPENVQNLDDAISANTELRQGFVENLKTLEEGVKRVIGVGGGDQDKAIVPIISIPVPSKTGQPTGIVQPGAGVSLKDLVNKVSAVGDIYEKQFVRVTNALDVSIEKSKAAALKSKELGLVAKTISTHIISTSGSALKGAFNGLTFIARPTQWKATAEAVATFVTPTTGESQRDYERRVRDFVANDVQSPADRVRLTGLIFDSMPNPVNIVSQQQRDSAILYRAAVADSIMSDPIAFMAEAAGGLAGGWVAGKIIGKLPNAVKRLTPKTLEEKAFARIRPLDIADDLGGTASAISDIQDAIGSNPATSMGKGKWNLSGETLNSLYDRLKDVPKSRRGYTSLAVLVNPGTGKILGVLNELDILTITHGIPELLATMGGVQVLTMVRPDVDVSPEMLKELNRFITKPAVIPDSIIAELNPNDELLTTLLGLGVVVLPDLDTNIIGNADLKSDTIQELEESLKTGGTGGVVFDTITEQIQDIDLDEDTILEPPVQEQIQDVDVDQIQELDDPEPVIINEEDDRLLRLKKKDKPKRSEKEIVAKAGRSRNYRVVFILDNGTSESHIVPAKGYFDALAKGEKKKKSKRDTVEVEIYND